MTNRDRIQRTSDGLYAAWNAHDPEALGSVYAKNAQLFDVISGVTTRGRDSIRLFAAESFIGFPDFTVTRHAMLIDHDTCAERWVMAGTHAGEFEGLPPTGNRLEVRGATFSEYDDEARIVHSTNYVDVPSYLRQLGLT